MTTKALRTSRCRHCGCPIGLSVWSGWIDLSRNGSFDMCPATVSAVHEPAHRTAVLVERPELVGVGR